MEDNKFDLKGFLNDPKAQADKAGAVKFLQEKGIIDAQGKPVTSVIKDGAGMSNPPSPFTSGPIGSLPGVKQFNQFGVGMASAIGSAGLNLGKAASKVVGGISKLIGNKPAQEFYGATVPGNIDTINKKILKDPYQSDLSSISGKVGNLTGTVAPYIATGGPIAGGTNKVVQVASDLAEAKKFGSASAALFRTLSGAGAEAAQNYVLGYALSGGDKDQAKWQAAISGVLKGVTAGVGEVLKATGVDTAFMNKIYKSTKSEQEANLFGKKDTSLAQEAIDRGIGGNIKQQAVKVQQGLTDSESKIEAEFAKMGNPQIQLDNAQRYVDAIQKRIALLETSGATEEAQGLKSSLANISPDGKITANSALGLRRLLDSMRQSKSFLSQTEELQAGQAGLKEMSDSLRSKINSIGLTGSVMKDYQFFINAKNSLLDYAKSNANKATLDFFDKLVLAESIFAHTPVGLGITAGKMAALRSPASTAQFISKLPVSSPGGTAFRSAAGGITTPLMQSQSPK